MNELQIFNNPEFGEIRTIEENGRVLFCGVDMTRALGYKNSSKALSDHCKGVTKRYAPTTSGDQEMNFIPEGDIYRLAAKSELPGADRFESWIFDEVLPSIRHHGVYATAETAERLMNDPDFMIQTFTALKDEREKRKALEAKAEADKPKVLFADAVAASKTAISIGGMAKLLKQNGVDTGRTRLFEWLRGNGYLIRQEGMDYNSPTQRSMDVGVLEIEEKTVMLPDGRSIIEKTPRVTGKGQQYFIEKFLNPGKKKAAPEVITFESGRAE